MRPITRHSVMIALIISITVPVWGQEYFLYSPQPATPEQLKRPADGILVQEIEVQKGDTLFDLSRKFSGKGMYFPQILLFNSLKNPDRIYPGNTLKIPVANKKANDYEQPETRTKTSSRTRKIETHPVAARQATVSASPNAGSSNTELSLTDLKPDGTNKNVKKRLKKKKTDNARKTTIDETLTENIASSRLPAAHKSATAKTDSGRGGAAGQKLFESAVKAYRKDDCRVALELLDRYLADNSGSPLAADASLYRAECYLKLSAQ